MSTIAAHLPGWVIAAGKPLNLTLSFSPPPGGASCFAPEPSALARAPRRRVWGRPGTLVAGRLVAPDDEDERGQDGPVSGPVDPVARARGAGAGLGPHQGRQEQPVAFARRRRLTGAGQRLEDRGNQAGGQAAPAASTTQKKRTRARSKKRAS